MTPRPSQQLIKVISDLRPGRIFERAINHEHRNLWLLAAAFGFGAGLLAGVLFFLVASAFKNNPLNTAVSSGNNVVIENNNVSAAPTEKVSQNLQEHLTAAALGVYRRPADGAETVPMESFLSSAVSLTSDGWLATVKNPAVNTGQLKNLGAVWQRKFYPAEKVLEDSLINLVFIKIKAEGLTIVPFANLEKPQKGDELLAFDGLENFFAPRLLNSRFYLFSGARLSETLDVLSAIGEAPAGAPVFNNRGSLVGVSMSGGKMIPIDYISSGLAVILKEGKLRRPSLGVRYLDLSSEIFTGETKLGAKLASSKDGKALVKGGTGEKAGLQEGDVILAVDKIELNENQTLAETVASFTPGVKVNLTISRGGKELKVGVTL